MRAEFARVTLLGNRESNQDRVAVAVEDDIAMAVVIDGMGGHARGDMAAEVARSTVLASFDKSLPIDDPKTVLARALVTAHNAVTKLGTGLPLELMPRATCALCILLDGKAWWAHVGDARIYHLGKDGVNIRTRDHSHVEGLLQDGVITEDEISQHPMRNFVESCIGGDPSLPTIGLSDPAPLSPGDVLMACSDGLWDGVSDDEMVERLVGSNGVFNDSLRELCESAVKRTAPSSDNTSAAAIRYLGR